MAIMEKKDTSRARRSFPDEFKTDAVAMTVARSSTSPKQSVSARARSPTGCDWRGSSAGHVLV
jgi:transposase-like protein